MKTTARLVDRLKPAGEMRQFRQNGSVPRPKRGVASQLLMRRPPAQILGRIGALEARLAQSRGELKRAQRLRYQVFYEEMSAAPSALAMMSRRDEDMYDGLCDHVLVVDRAAPNASPRPWPRRPRIVGTYRLLRQDVAEIHAGFYTQGEFDLQPLIDLNPERRFLELGRSCVLKSYRNRRTVELLWQGVWNYVRENGYDVMIGCASFEGTDPERHAETLSYLHHTALAPESWRVRAHEHLRVDMNMLPRERIDARVAMKSLPPLIKGYLRVGAFVGDGAVIDHQFGTTDVFVIMPITAINARYLSHFGRPDEIAAPIPDGFAVLN